MEEEEERGGTEREGGVEGEERGRGEGERKREGGGFGGWRKTRRPFEVKTRIPES